ncbi:hypothetical protein [Streptacidiphilus pinicola]|uniref:hypothetical protein n=1 Tax=Streptacidiphilus pinicola TaxID=2219663 RepID=UPI001058184C|nr:hypothetical protein [Streptacidiphilus pinicola]
MSTASGTAAPTAGHTLAAACRTAGPPSVSGTGPGDPAAAARSVADDYTKFFDPRLSDSAKAALLQDSPKKAVMVQLFTTNTDERMGSANVTAVHFTGPTTADVTVTLCLGGDVGLQDMKGQAVLENGTWKVADATLCRVLTENNNGDPVAACT